MIQLVEYVRLSLGTAMKLGLDSGRYPDNFTTAFIMTYNADGCTANCSFCPQAIESNSNPELLSRIGWPLFKVDDVKEKLLKQEDLQRVCIQSLNYPEVVSDVIDIANIAKRNKSVRISVCIHPIGKDEMIRLKDSGIDNIGIALDACTKPLFDQIKGKARNISYSWEGHREAIKQAQSVFGVGNVTTHLIVGLGESEADIVEFLFDMKRMNVRVGLFAFTPVDGTRLEKREQPNLSTYRRVQILRNLIAREKITRDEVTIDSQGKIHFKVPSDLIRKLLGTGSAFQVTGCPGCNRPYYNERPRGPMYNYPRPLTEDEISEALEEAGLVN